MIDNNLIKQFLAFVESGALNSAAESLGLATSSLSRSLKRLEHETGLQLTTPKGRQLILTPTGKEFAIVARKHWEEWEQSLLKLNTKTQATLPLRLATFEIFSTHFAAKLVEQHFTDRKVRVLERVPGEIEQAILDGEADLGLTYTPYHHPKLKFLKVSSSLMGIFVKQGHFTKATLTDLPFAVPWVPLRPHVKGSFSLDLWPESLERQVQYEFQQLETALSLALRGKCAIHLPLFLVPIVNELHQHKLIDIANKFPHYHAPKMNIYLVLREDIPEGSDAKKLARAIRVSTQGETHD